MPKVRVEIIGKSHFTKKKCRVRGNLIEIEKETKKHPAYTAEFTEDCLLTEEYGRIRKKTRWKLMILSGATKCISFASKRGQLKKDLPYLDRAAIKHHFEKEVMHKQGTVHSKLDVPMALYVMVFVLIGLAFVNILMSSGRVAFV